MFQKLFNIKYRKATFEDVQHAISSTNHHIILNTLPKYEQSYLIHSTIHFTNEEDIINDMINNYELKTKKIIIYGKNSFDNTMELKYDQLTKLGFFDIHIYSGGMFEWLLLKDIY
jgi:hypothetical protein